MADWNERLAIYDQPADRCPRFEEEHNTTIFKSLEAVMNDYVLVPD